MKRAGDDGIADGGTLCSERKGGDAKFSAEGIRSSAEDGDVVGPVRGNDVGFEELRRGVGPVNEDVGLAEIAESLQDVRGGDEITLRIDEEGVAEKSVANAFAAGRFVAGINDGTECGFESGIGLVRRRLLCSDTIWKDEWWKDERHGKEQERRRKMMDLQSGLFHRKSRHNLRLAQAGFAWKKVSEMCEQIVTSAKA